MRIDLTGMLRNTIGKLETEKKRIERQVNILKQALSLSGSLNGVGTDMSQNPARRRRKRMSPKARRAVSARMKAYWAKRRGGRLKTGKKRAT
jgi:hypothetical protein